MEDIITFKSTARDPNELLVSPEGDIRPGDTLTYTINYENEGESIAYGVYITDTLEEDLDTTLTINNGSYNSNTRTITWFIGELQSKQKGSVTFSVNAKQDLPDMTEIINFATVYFPSVPGTTRTNGTVNRVTTFIDNIAPTTTAQALPQPNPSGWNNSDVTITLTATDNEGGSGVSKIEYSLDNTNWTAYATPFNITNEGTTTLYYKSTDNAGNIESIKTLEIKIDKTPPIITAQSLPQPNSYGWNNSDVTVAFTAQDTLSGIASVTDPITVTTEGTNQYIGGEASDLADNKATTYAIINIDKTPPDITLTLNSIKLSDDDEDDDEGSWYEFLYSATDSLSGLNSLRAGLMILPIEGYKVEIERDDELEIKINEEKKELKIESPSPQEILSQLQAGLLNLNSGQILQLKLKQGEPKWKIKEKDDKGIKIQAPSIIFTAEAVDYADNITIKELEFKKEKDDED